MGSGRGRRNLLRLSIGAGITLGCLSLLGAGFVYREQVLEEWYFCLLEANDRYAASKWLGEHGSTKTAQRLFDLSRRLLSLKGSEMYSGPVHDSLVEISGALRESLSGRGGS